MDPIVAPLPGHSLVVARDRAECVRTVDALRRLADSVAETVAFLLHQSRLESDAGSAGRWATAYGAQCRLAVDTASDLEGDLRRLAAALARLTQDLDEVAALLARAETIAAPHGLVVDRRLLAPGDPAPRAVVDATTDRRARAAYDRALALVEQARRLERQARAAWAAALAGDGGPELHEVPRRRPGQDDWHFLPDLLSRAEAADERG